MKKTICLLLAALMAAVLCPAAFAVGMTGSGAVSEPPVNPDAVFQRDEDEKEYDPNEIVTLIVKLKGAPIAAVSSDLRSPSSSEAAKKLSLEQERVKAETAALHHSVQA